MSKKISVMDRRDFVKKSGIGLFGAALAPSFLSNLNAAGRLRTAHIGLGGMGMADLDAISSHELVDVVALCDVDSINLAKAKALHLNAKTYADYRELLRDMGDDIDAVIVSTPDHTHAPASIMAMELNKPVYCQKPLTHHVSEARAMNKMAAERNLVTQMGIQVHSFYDYKLATLLIQSGIIGKVHTVRAWSPKNWGYDGPGPTGSDPVPSTLDWNLWQGTAAERPYKEGFYHPGNWRKVMDYGCGTLGDMGVHIFDTPYNALQLDVPETILNECRLPTGFGFPEHNIVTYEFPGTDYTAEKLKWVWYDGGGAPSNHLDLVLPDGETLPDQGAMFMGEKGRLLLPHFQQLPRKIVDGKYVEMDIESFNLGKPVKDYDAESKKHYHQFVDACLGKGETTAPFSYAARLTETILLGVIAGRFPNQTLHWNSKKAKFDEKEPNEFLDGKYREF
ncbi:Gfo/Idh/MocA family protein [Algoriphagus yeomjeoni]|uniref:Putative dehydrogenase n=1 Tax=Algoriphagus yeomjeoni TaxID=291403 RepID=A0A327PA71_9BACT|nr:Gfo/Idh/MocA family oxidoreductase [Algoriphagus yeomjeoni]RAI87902.1 putative dehydrogenase [Algoriphagus yeomjeoni]